MSLRWRLCLALAALAALATTVMASTAYTSTRSRLEVELDRSLVGRLDSVLEVGSRMPMGRWRASLRAEELFASDIDVQIVDAGGDVVARSGSESFPVEPGDLEPGDLEPGDLESGDLDPGDLDAGDRDAAGSGPGQGGAGAGAAPRIRTVSVEGEAYRLASRPLPGGGAVQVARSLSETQRVLDALQRRFALVGVSVVAGAAALGYLIARRATRALERLTATAEHVADTGELTVPIGVGTGGADETGRLARAMATMLDALERSRRQQRELVQDASHELRTPITSLRTNIDILRRHPDLPADQRGAVLAELKVELDELGQLLSELVATAGDTGEAEEAQVLSLDAAVRQVAARVGRRHDRRIELHGEGAEVEIQPLALVRAITNLLENAVKFSPPGSVVHAVLAGGRLAVHDEGPGVHPDDRARVFDRFYRSPAARTLPGSGLGLAIVAQVVRHAGGDVFVVPRPSEGPGREAAPATPWQAWGAVGFTLPVVAAPVAVAAG